MTRRQTLVIGYIAASLDGRITDSEGGVGWLDAFADHDHGYADFYASIDTLVMGRATYDAVRGFGDWPYPGKPCLVLTTRPCLDAPLGVVPTEPDFAALRATLQQRGSEMAWIVGGARTIAGALAEGALDRLHLFTMPVILGDGTPLFAGGTAREASLVLCRSWPSGAVESVYSFTEDSPR